MTGFFLTIHVGHVGTVGYELPDLEMRSRTGLRLGYLQKVQAQPIVDLEI
jgi:hypothetical protein